MVVEVGAAGEVISGGHEVRLTIGLGGWLPGLGGVIEVCVDVLVLEPAEAVLTEVLVQRLSSIKGRRTLVVGVPSYTAGSATL